LRKRYIPVLIVALLLLVGLGVYITDTITVPGGSSPPFPEWAETHRSINPECDWRETLVVNMEVNPSHYNIRATGIDRQGKGGTQIAVPDICLGTPGMTCQRSETFPAEPDWARGRVDLEAEGGVVKLSGECQ
jgi:hypothetical protein